MHADVRQQRYIHQGVAGRLAQSHSIGQANETADPVDPQQEPPRLTPNLRSAGDFRGGGRFRQAESCRVSMTFQAV